MIATNLTFHEFESMEETEIEKLLNLEITSTRGSSYVMPNYEKLTKKLSKPGITMQLLWEEYNNSI